MNGPHCRREAFVKRGVFRWLSRFLGRRHSRARRGCAPDRVRTLVALGRATAAFGLGSGGAPSAMAEAVRGLVIGIDRYVELPDLRGAVNDARDVAGALRRVGADDLVLLEESGWVEEVVVQLLPFDAGTDSGVTFTSANQVTDPPIAVARIHVSPFDMSAPLGTFTFTRTAHE